MKRAKHISTAHFLLESKKQNPLPSSITFYKVHALTNNTCLPPAQTLRTPFSCPTVTSAGNQEHELAHQAGTKASLEGN